MKKVGVRELKSQGSRILREVREGGESFEVTYHGQVVARLVPVSKTARELEIEAWITKGDELAKKIGKHWPPGLTAEQAIREDRDRGIY